MLPVNHNHTVERRLLNCILREEIVQAVACAQRHQRRNIWSNKEQILESNLSQLLPRKAVNWRGVTR